VKQSPARKVAAACILILGLVLAVSIVVFGLDRDAASNKDYLEYWSAEQLLAHGQNPYDWNATLKLERTVGFNRYPALMSLSPPVAMFFLLPLGWVDAGTGLVGWTLFLMACTVASVWLIWLMLGKPDTRYHVIGIFFPPVLRCIMAGQIGILLMLEITLFFYLQKSRPFWAGAALVFFSLKPHLVLPCFLVLALWSIAKREYRILAGFCVAFAVSCGLITAVDHHVWAQYREMTRTSPIMDQLLPTASIWMRFLIDPKARWIEFIPEVAACAWAVWYFWTRRERWDWTDQGMLLLVVAVACSPYSWYTDQAVLLPPVVAGLNESEKSIGSMILFALVAGAGLVALVIDIKLLSGFFAWTAPAWLLWYAVARMQRVRKLAS
jgi:Glycosyltransferase family 87